MRRREIIAWVGTAAGVVLAIAAVLGLIPKWLSRPPPPDALVATVVWYKKETTRWIGAAPGSRGVWEVKITNHAASIAKRVKVTVPGRVLEFLRRKAVKGTSRSYDRVRPRDSSYTLGDMRPGQTEVVVAFTDYVPDRYWADGVEITCHGTKVHLILSGPCAESEE